MAIPSQEEIFDKVREALVDALGVDEDEVTPNATLRGDLDAESIDFLDIVFRLERKVGTVRQLEPPVVVAACVAIGIIVGLAELRFWLERTLGIPQDFVATAVVPLATILP